MIDSAASPPPAPPTAGSDDYTYRGFSEKQLTGFGTARRSRIERARLGLLARFQPPPGHLLEVGPGHGSLALAAVADGWDYTAVEPSPLLAETLRSKGLKVVEAFVPPFPAETASMDVVYADQVLEHMPGIDAARAFTAEAMRVLKPGGVFFVVVPDYRKERMYFWDVDYTHNFVTTPRRMRQMFYDAGFTLLHEELSIGVATGAARVALAALGWVAQWPGTDEAAHLLGADEFLFKVRKNLFQTITVVARKPAAA
ncbi:MAG: methyltransferase domain-containing protein [Vicinamibacteraceae bacterium]|nr:methyltransferase domain-containing protein [Vicinamibacteraceae bacterium]